MSTDLKKTTSYWGNEDTWSAGLGIYWLELPAVQRRWNRKVSGREDLDWVSYSLNKHFSGRLPLSRCASLGCGKGWLERRLAAENAFLSCDAFDAAPACVSKAKADAQAAGYINILYAVSDLNQIKFQASKYDAIWAAGILHHLDNLEAILAEVASALRPHGLLILNEYVGPSRFQFPQRQREIMQAALALLPLRYRRFASQRVEADLARSPVRKGIGWLLRRLIDKTRDRDLLGTVHRRWAVYWATQRKADLFKTTLALPTARDVTAADQSESIWSQEILDILPHFFELVEVKELGGGLLQFLLDGIAHNFDERDPQAMIMLNLLFQIEDSLMACGELRNDFVYAVARPKGEDANV